MKQKKLLMLVAIVLVAVLCASVLAGCKKKKPNTDTPNTPGSSQVGAIGDITEVYNNLLKAYVYSEDAKASLKAALDEGKTNIEAATTPEEIENAVTAAKTAYKAVNAESANKFTYDYAMSVFPTNWNPHIYQTNTDSEILGYIVNGFYRFDYNDEKNGYKVVPDMATAQPVDVTANYVGETWGIAEGDTARAWKISLRDDIKWQDGTAIKAADFVESAKLLLNPKAANYRADSLYSGNMVIYNAQNYLKQGSSLYEKISNLYADLNAAKEANITIYLDYDIISSTFKNDWFGGTYAQVASAGYLAGYFSIYRDATAEELEANPDVKRIKTAENFFDKYLGTEAKDGDRVELTDAMIADYANCDDWNPSANDELPLLTSTYYTYPAVSMENVGVIATGEYELTIVLEKELEGFYLLYALTDSWLVNANLYNSCISEDEGVYSNSYGTSVGTTISYGPYKLTYFQNDKSFSFEKNPYWYGYNDIENLGRYMTTNVNVQYVEAAATRLQMFTSGQLDSYGLTSDDMKDYSTSDYCYYTTGDSTFFIALNPNADALTAEQAKTAGTNKTILTLLEFRQALSFALDRAAFCLATSPTNNAGFAVFSSFIISDPDNGTAYRTTDQAKKVMVKFWGLENDIGEGKLYETIDDAIESITGYNLAKAQKLFNVAYAIATTAEGEKVTVDGVEYEGKGLMSASDVVEIKVGTPNLTSNFYNKGYDFLVNNYTEAVKGTSLEGKIRFTRDGTLGNDFSKALKNNKVDMLFGVGWTGSALDPYGLVEAYTSPSYQYDPSWDTTTSACVVNIEGVDYTASVMDWTNALAGDEITITSVADKNNTKKITAGSKDDPTMRLDILAALENAILETYDMIPIMDDSSASMKGMQINYYTENYIYGVGRGGMKYMTYSYTDSEWTAFVESNGGELNYK